VKVRTWSGHCPVCCGMSSLQVAATNLVLSVMGVTLRTNANVAFRCGYHVVWCPKYRRTVIGGRMEARLKEIIAEVITEQGAWLIEMETMAGQVRLLSVIKRYVETQKDR
jgi:hypothetical protein